VFAIYGKHLLFYKTYRMKRQFSFKIYTLLEAFILLISVLGLFVLGCALVGKLFNADHTHEIGAFGEAILKFGMVLLIIGAFSIASTAVTTTMYVQIDDMGLSFSFDKSKLGFRRRDVFIVWTDLKGWYHSEAHISGDTWSSPNLVIQYLNRRRFLFYYPNDTNNDRQYQRFFEAFLSQVNLFNEKNKHLKPIRALNYFKMYKPYTIIGAILMLIPCFIILEMVIFEPSPNDKTERILMYVFTIAVPVLCIFLSYKMFKEIFSKEE
jgi:hypothetical protein